MPRKRPSSEGCFVRIQKWFNKLRPALSQLKARGHTLVAIHLRRGDFGKLPFPIAPTAWYLKWLSQVWQSLDKPILYIASDDIDRVLSDFKAYSPLTSKDFDHPLKSAPYFFDFYILSQSDLLAISNSTFSAAAALLNTNAKGFLRPNFDQFKLIPYDPWNSVPWERRLKY